MKLFLADRKEKYFFLSVNPTFILFQSLKKGVGIRWGMSTLDQLTVSGPAAKSKLF